MTTLNKIKSLTVITAVSLLSISPAANAAVADFAQAPLKATEEYKQAVQEVKSLEKMLETQKQTLKKCVKNKCTTKTVLVPLESDEYNDAQNELQDAINDLNSLVDTRSSDRNTKADEFVNDQATARESATQTWYEGENERVDGVLDAAKTDAEGTLSIKLAMIQAQYDKWVSTNTPPSPEELAANKEACLKLTYGSKATSIPKIPEGAPKKPSQPKLNGKWPRSAPKDKKSKAYKEYQEDKKAMEDYKKAEDQYKKDLKAFKSNLKDSYDDCVSLENETDSDTWLENQTNAFQTAAEAQIAQAEKTNDKEHATIEKQYNLRTTSDERARSTDEKDNQKAINKLDKEENSLAQKLETQGERHLSKLSS